MSNFPTFNYKTVYFFIMSLFGIVFVLSLMGLIKVQYPFFISFTSIVNVFFGIAAWIRDNDLDNSLSRKRSIHGIPRQDYEEYHYQKSLNLIVITILTFISTLFGLIVQVL